MTGFTGTGKDVPLGDFLMAVQVERNGKRYAVSFSNKMPDNPEILQGDTADARLLKDGSLAFSFTDGWGNEGHAQLRPLAKSS